MSYKVRNSFLCLFEALSPADGICLPLRFITVALLSASILSCANVGNPNGGPYDETPPKYVRSHPAMNQLNFKGKNIEITFDEFISIDNPNENVIITPPQKQNPIIQPLGKKVRVELRDTLLEQTTYTIDFTSSIVDNNEKNALENFSFAFSTGDVLDSLQISGLVINAEDMEPVQKMLVGIHRDLSDTAFTKTMLLRTSKTDERGRFVIRNIRPDSYRAFALEDKNRNFAYDKNNNEGLAFLDSIFIPSCERAMVSDTIWKDSITVDTVMLVERTLFYPNDLILWFFKDSIAPKQRMLRPERVKEHIMTLKFNAPLDTFPKPVPLNFEPADSLWYISQKGDDRENFSINYWILDSMIYKMDTLQVEVSYWKNNDSIPDLFELKTDTLDISYKAPKESKKQTKPKRSPTVRKAADALSDSTQATPEVIPAIPLQLSITPSGSLNPYDVITIITNEPVMDVRKEHFVMEMAVDTLWEAVDFEFEADSTRAMTYFIKRTFNYDEKYRIIVDSAKLTSVYNHSNNQLKTQMAVKGKNEYGLLKFTIQGLPLIKNSPSNPFQSIPSVDDSDSTFIQSLLSVDDSDTTFIQSLPSVDDSDTTVIQNLPSVDDSDTTVIQNLPSVIDSSRVMPAFMELLNSSGAPVRKTIVENGVASFKDLNPEKYYVRIILDANENGRWDAGNYEERRQPELIYYYMQQFEVRQNWTKDEKWDIRKSVLGQKPSELIKNKPKEETKKKRDYKEESRPQKSNNSTPSIGGLRF